MPRVIIADDHVLIREGLRRLLAREADMEVAGEASSFPGLLALVESKPADVVVTDVNMPGPGDALDALKSIRARRPQLPVVVLSMMQQSQAALGFLIAGAAAYVSKEAAAEELVAAIRRVANGYRYVSPALSQRFARSEARDGEVLSPREREVLCLIALGFTVKEIAAQFRLSISTVHTHRARLLQKLQLRSDVELSRYAVQHRLVEWK